MAVVISARYRGIVPGPFLMGVEPSNVGQFPLWKGNWGVRALTFAVLLISTWHASLSNHYCVNFGHTMRGTRFQNGEEICGGKASRKCRKGSL